VFKKSFSLIFFVVILLSCNYQKAMDNESLSKRRKFSDEGCSYSVSLDNQNDYCEALKKLPLSKNCRKIMRVNEKNLGQYTNLVDELFRRQDMDFKELFSAFNIYFKAIDEGADEFYGFQKADSENPASDQVIKKKFIGIKLDEFNIILKALTGFILDNEEINILNKILVLIFINRDFNSCRNLRYLLVNYGFYPLLKRSVNSRQKETFLIYLAGEKFTDIKLFNLILNNVKKNTRYDLEELFNLRDRNDHKVLHHAVYSKSEDKVKTILELMLEKDFCLNRFIYEGGKQFRKKNLLEDVNAKGYSKMVDLLVNYFGKDLVKKLDDECDIISNLPLQNLSNYNIKIEEHCIILAANMCKVSQDEYLAKSKYKGDLAKYLPYLVEYKRLLYEILNVSCVNFDELFAVVDNYLNKGYFSVKASLDDLALISLILKALINHRGDIKNIILNFHEQVVFEKELNEIFTGWIDKEDKYGHKNDKFAKLGKILINNDLYPKLNKIFNKRIKGTFFMFLVGAYTYCADGSLISKNADDDLFNLILYKESDKNYRWDDLFKMVDLNGNTVLHYAVSNGSKDRVETILNLMQKKRLDVKDFINIKNNGDKTPLMLAASQGDFELINLLVNYGANINLISKESSTALDYMLKSLSARSNINDDECQILKCIQLLS